MNHFFTRGNVWKWAITLKQDKKQRFFPHFPSFAQRTCKLIGQILGAHLTSLIAPTLPDSVPDSVSWHVPATRGRRFQGAETRPEFQLDCHAPLKKNKHVNKSSTARRHVTFAAISTHWLQNTTGGFRAQKVHNADIERAEKGIAALAAEAPCRFTTCSKEPAAVDVFSVEHIPSRRLRLGRQWAQTSFFQLTGFASSVTSSTSRFFFFYNQYRPNR